MPDENGYTFDTGILSYPHVASECPLPQVTVPLENLTPDTLFELLSYPFSRGVIINGYDFSQHVLHPATKESDLPRYFSQYSEGPYANFALENLPDITKEDRYYLLHEFASPEDAKRHIAHLLNTSSRRLLVYRDNTLAALTLALSTDHRTEEYLSITFHESDRHHGLARLMVHCLAMATFHSGTVETVLAYLSRPALGAAQNHQAEDLKFFSQFGLHARVFWSSKHHENMLIISKNSIT